LANHTAHQFFPSDYRNPASLIPFLAAPVLTGISSYSHHRQTASIPRFDPLLIGGVGLREEFGSFCGKAPAPISKNLHLKTTNQPQRRKNEDNKKPGDFAESTGHEFFNVDLKIIPTD
jgi:hypothetical protein